MSINHDPNWNDPVCYDDRNAETDPDFEVIDELAESVSWSDPDPATDGEDEDEVVAQTVLEAKLDDPITRVIGGKPGSFW